MVARVLLDACASVQAADGLADVHEGLVVASAGEAGGGYVDAFAGEVLDEELFDGVGAGGAGEVVGAAVAVEDTKVAAGDHVEVEVCEDVVGLGGIEVLSVVFGA